MLNKIKNEIKIIKWPPKEKVIKDMIVIIVSSIVLMIIISLLQFIANSLINFII